MTVQSLLFLFDVAERPKKNMKNDDFVTMLNKNMKTIQQVKSINHY
jgi:hypothetical protein